MADRSGDWFRQAEHDCRHARHAAEDGDHDWACFAAQQAAEQALKALAARLGGDAWGHSLLTLVSQLAVVVPEVVALREAAIRLDRYYIQTRYPNGFDAGAPADYFLEADARGAIVDATSILDFVRHRVP